MEIEIKENHKAIQSKENITHNQHLNTLIQTFTSSKHQKELTTIIRYLLYYKSIDECKNLYKFMKLRYPEIDDAFTIHNIFLEWNPYEKHDMGLIRGIFLEKLTHHFLKKIYPNEKIYCESKIIIDNYKSYDIDFVIKIKNILKVYESKFSTKALKRHQLDNFGDLLDKYTYTEIFLVFFERKKEVQETINEYIRNTKRKNTIKLLKNINLITLENFTKNIQ